MRNDIEYENRQLIPRWLPYKRANFLNQKTRINKKDPNELELRNYNQLVDEWNKYKSISYAINLIASSHTLGIEEDDAYKEAIEFIINNDRNLENNHLLSSMLGHKDYEKSFCEDEKIEKTQHKNIHQNKLLVKQNPYDSLGWMDLAFYYVLEGNIEKSERCIKIALDLNHSNQHIIRSAARFYVFREDPGQALHIIRNSDSFLYNPLILSSEISICEAFDIKSKVIKQAKRMIDDKEHSVHSLSELNATIATLEFNYGSSKQGKKYLAQALAEPNENTLAQAQYLIKKYDGNLDPGLFEIPCKYEADAWNGYQKMEFDIALHHAENWFYYQPFSSRSAILYSYIQLLIFEDNTKAITLLDTALKLSKNDFTLQNNRAVALAKSGDINRAQKALNDLLLLKIEDADDRGVIKATTGLIEFKKGNVDAGREKYQEAIDIFRKSQYPNRECLAYYYWFKEEELLDKKESEKILILLEDLVNKYNYTDIKYVLKMIN